MGDALPVLFQNVKQYMAMSVDTFVMHEVNGKTKISGLGKIRCHLPSFQQCTGEYHDASDPFEVILDDNFVPALLGGGALYLCIVSDSNQIQC